MSIAKKDNLHLLIKSLSKTEKKYFRDFLKKSSQPKLYLQLFNQLEKQSKHDKNEIKKVFDTKAKELPVIKTYLTQILLKSLTNFHRQSSNFDKIHQKFSEINILLQKELFDIAEFEIEKIISLCRKKDFQHELLQSLEFKKQFLLQKFGPGSETSKKALLEAIEEQNSLLGKIYNLHQYQEIQASFYEHFHQTAGLNPTIYTNLHKNSLLAEEKSAESLPAQILRAELLYSLHIFKDKNYQEARQSIEKVIKQIEYNPEFIRENPLTYLSLLNKQVELLLHLKHFTEIPLAIEKIRQVPESYQLDTLQPAVVRPMMEASALELQLYTSIKDHIHAENLISKLDQQFKNLDSPALKQWPVILNAQIAEYYLETDQISQAVQRIKTIKSAESSLRENETLFQTLQLDLILALKQKNFLQLKQSLQHLQKYYQAFRKPTRLEKHFLKMLKDFPTLLIQPRKHKQLKKRLLELNDAFEKSTDQNHSRYSAKIGNLDKTRQILDLINDETLLHFNLKA
ncbi:hypothetical protein IT411_04200 [Candidatus Peregrinibacteria bacterium]|nr:hypothetical protein [Candidatus Peregrinibacteria bacterium]